MTAPTWGTGAVAGAPAGRDADAVILVGSWARCTGGVSRTVEDDVAMSLALSYPGDVGEERVRGIAAAYRDLVDAELPQGLYLRGDEFYTTMGAYRLDEAIALIGAVVADCVPGFWDIVIERTA